MTRDARLELVALYFDALNRGDLETAIAQLSPAFVQHTRGLPPGPKAARWSLELFFGAFPNLRFDVDWVLADDDRVVVRSIASGTHTGPFLGHQPTGRPFRATGIDVFRVADGRITERWTEFDTFGMLQQLGIGPPPARRPS